MPYRADIGGTYDPNEDPKHDGVDTSRSVCQSFRVRPDENRFENDFEDDPADRRPPLPKFFAE